MIEVEMNTDIREIEPKLILFFTTRQVICCLAGVAVGVIVGLLIPGDVITKVMVGGCCGAPFCACGWIKIFGLPPEKMLPKMATLLFIPQNRKYMSKTEFDYIDEKHPIKKTKKCKELKAYK